MSQQEAVWRSSAVAGALVVGAISVLTLALDGCGESGRQQKEFESQLVLQGLQADTREEAARYFDLIRDLGLITDSDLSDAIEQVADEPERIPLLRATCLGALNAVDDAYSIRVGQDTTVNVLSNDTVVDGGMFDSGTPQGNGSVRFSDSVGPDYTFAGAAVGNYAFQYTVGCPGSTSTQAATVNITVGQ